MREDDDSPDPKSAEPTADAPDGNGNGHHTQDTVTDDDTPPGTEVPDLAQTLLHTEVARDDKPGHRFAYPLWGMLLATAFILFHGTVLLVHNLPSKGLSKGVQTWFDKHLDMNRYFQATGNSQSWAMFAPNPHRSNIFMKVEVLDAHGDLWDMKHDMYGKRTYPYLWYDRRGKVNRRLVDQKGYRRHYAAWVCREWERTHGELPDEVKFTKMWTKIPTPGEVYKNTKGRPWIGFDPMKLHLNEREEDTIDCASTRHGQLPNYLRIRHGMEPMPEGHFRGQHTPTWVDKAKDEAKKAEREERRRELEEEREPEEREADGQ